MYNSLNTVKIMFGMQCIRGRGQGTDAEMGVGVAALSGKKWQVISLSEGKLGLITLVIQLVISRLLARSKSSHPEREKEEAKVVAQVRNKSFWESWVGTQWMERLALQITCLFLFVFEELKSYWVISWKDAFFLYFSK